MSLSQAKVQEAQAVTVLDAWEWLLREIRQALEPITPTGRLVPVAEAQATLETAIALLKELGHPQIMTFADDLKEKIPQLLAPLEWLEQQLRPVLQGVEQETQTLLLWAFKAGRDCGHSSGTSGCRKSALGHPGSVSPFLQSGGIVAQLAAPILADSPGDVPMAAALVATVLESPPV
jgi:hypothetical protein